jgi:hypothetical protein
VDVTGRSEYPRKKESSPMAYKRFSKSLNIYVIPLPANRFRSMRKDISPLVQYLRTRVAYLTTHCSDEPFKKMREAV